MTPLRLPRRRAGFTLIELLVVIAIIAILVALLASGIFYAFTRATDTGAIVEISQFDESLKTFKKRFGFYPPDRMRLYSSQVEYLADIQGAVAWSEPAFAQNSLTIINKMWPNIGQFSGLAWADGINPFNSNVPAGNPYGGVKFVDLEGDQCLVFFLQGIPLNASAPNTSAMPGFGGQGFSTNVKNPTQPPTPPGATGPGRDGPFYTFTATRLMPRPNQLKGPNGTPTNLLLNVAVTSPLPNQPPGIFLSYMDYFSSSVSAGQWANPQTTCRPYVYFSANNRTNGYNAFPPPLLQSFGYYIQLPGTDQLNANRFVTAYFQPLSAANASQSFQRPDTFQIISAGRDGIFNSVPQPIATSKLSQSPFQWSQTNATFLWQTTLNNTPVGGMDDLADFYGNKLGISQ